MIVLPRTNGIYSDPRIEKVVSFLESKKIKYLVIGWDRKLENLVKDNTIYFRKKSGYNIGGLKAVCFRLAWMFFFLKQLCNRRSEITTIHAFDLDTAFPACLFKCLFNRRIVVVFDICDWFSSNFSGSKSFLLKMFYWMERFSIVNSDEVIICEPERIEQIPFELKKKEIIVPNIPSFSDESFLKIDEKYQFNNGKLTLAYVGGFSSERCLDELLNLSRNQHINLLIAGYGTSVIESRCTEISNLPNVKYLGKVSYKEGLRIMYNADLCYAMYAKSNANHLYAAPNKYYESMMVGRAIISTKGIKLSEKILDNNMGYIVDEDEHEIELLLTSLLREDVMKKGLNARKLWEKKYRDYIQNFFENEYLTIINV